MWWNKDVEKLWQEMGGNKDEAVLSIGERAGYKTKAIRNIYDRNQREKRALRCKIDKGH